MASDLDERLVLRFPGLSRQLVTRVMRMPTDSAIRRRVLGLAFRTHGGTSHPTAGVFRTPEEQFDGLPDFPFEPNYRNV